MATRGKSAPPGTYWRGNTLWGRTEVAGREHRWSLRTHDPRVASRRFEDERQRLIAELHYGEVRRTFDETFASWANHIKHSVAGRTIERYLSSIGQLLPMLEGKPLLDINGRLIAEIIRWRGSGGVTTATIKRDLVALSSIMQHPMMLGWREDNPVLARLPLLKERRDPIVLPEAVNIEKLIAFVRNGGGFGIQHAGTFDRLIEAAWRTGCRQDELVKARARDFDRTRKRLTVIGKDNKMRTIDLIPFDGFKVFEAIPAAGDALLFAGDDEQIRRDPFNTHRDLRERLEKQDQDFAAFCASIKHPFRFHDLRHQHAVDWLRSGSSLYDLQQRLGHTSIKTTEIYLAHLTPEEKRKAMGVP
jgi:integrase/recombinase XerD